MIARPLFELPFDLFVDLADGDWALLLDKETAAKLGMKGIDAGEPNSENLYTISEQELRSRGLESLPANLLEAVGELERDDVLRSALGRGRDEDYLDYFARVKRDEWFRYHEQVTPWEIREYLTRF